MRITGQVASPIGHTTAVPVPTQPITRPGSGITERIAAVHAARDSRWLRPHDAATPDRWHNPAPAGTVVAAPPRPKAAPKVKSTNGPGPRIRWDLDRAIAMRRKGASFRAIGEAVGADERAVGKKLRRLGIEAPAVQTVEARAVAMHHDGMTLPAICATLGIKYGTGHKWLTNAGEKPNPVERGITHGSSTGVRSHRRRGEEPCAECIEGRRRHQARERERDRARRAAA